MTQRDGAQVLHGAAMARLSELGAEIKSMACRRSEPQTLKERHVGAMGASWNALQGTAGRQWTAPRLRRRPDGVSAPKPTQEKCDWLCSQRQ